MPVALQLDYKTLTLDDYRTVGQALDFPADWPEGLLFHDSAEVDGRVRVYEVWEARAQFDQYIGDNFPAKVLPALGERADAPEITQIELNTAFLPPQAGSVG
jgi:hypothetical protein